MRTKIEKIILIRTGIFIVFFVGIFVFDWRLLALALIFSIWYFSPYVEAVFLVLFYSSIYGSTGGLWATMTPTLVVSSLVVGVVYLQRRLRIRI